MCDFFITALETVASKRFPRSVLIERPDGVILASYFPRNYVFFLEPSFRTRVLAT